MLLAGVSIVSITGLKGCKAALGKAFLPRALPVPLVGSRRRMKSWKIRVSVPFAFKTNFHSAVAKAGGQMASKSPLTNTCCQPYILSSVKHFIHYAVSRNGESQLVLPVSPLHVTPPSFQRAVKRHFSSKGAAI